LFAVTIANSHTKGKPGCQPPLRIKQRCFKTLDPICGQGAG